MSAKNPPTWVTSWPEWFGIFGNVAIVPKINHEALVQAVNDLPSGMAEMVFENSEKHLQKLIIDEGGKP